MLREIIGFILSMLSMYAIGAFLFAFFIIVLIYLF